MKRHYPMTIGSAQAVERAMMLARAKGDAARVTIVPGDRQTGPHGAWDRLGPGCTMRRRFPALD